MYSRFQHIHLVGVGGIGMSGIAALLLDYAYQVSGSDRKKTDTITQLEKRGLHFFLGHEERHIDGADLLVISSAISPENPEVLAAKEQGIPIIPRAEMLAELMRLKYGVAVAGAHGKTTTTSLIALLLTQAGLDPTVVVGGRMDNFGGTNARLGKGKFMVVEADESDGSFTKLSPTIAVITNLDREHMDHYETMDALKATFLAFVNKVPFYGIVIANGDDPYFKEIEPKITRRVKTFGFREENSLQILDYTPNPLGSSSRIRIQKEQEEIQLKIPGKHNMLNAVAAFLVGEELGIPREKTLATLEQFQGVQRRFQWRGEKNGTHFIDDYAHHPTEIQATLAAAKERFPHSRIQVIFQPHRFSRVKDLFHEFSQSFSLCDALYVTEIYLAGEKKNASLSSELLAKAIQENTKASVSHCEKPMQAIETFLAQSKPGDLILTLGAGDLFHVYQELF